MSKEKVLPRRYVSRFPGYRITVPKEIAERINANSILFMDDNPVFETKDPVVQQFIENHPAFKTHKIERAKTKEELEYEKQQAEFARAREEYRALYQDGVLVIDDKLDDSALRSIMKRIGIPTMRESEAGNLVKMSKQDMVAAILKALNVEPQNDENPKGAKVEKSTKKKGK